jgi:amiloride-sensitive sodium channel
MMKIVWLRFNESPTVTNVETTTYPIWNIPFPAVTLCNNNKVYQPAAIKLAESLWVLLTVHSLRLFLLLVGWD